MGILLPTLTYRLRTMIGDADGAYEDKYIDAINNASRDLYPDLFRRLIDETLITGNILPPFIWTSSSALALYSTSNITLEKTTTGGLFRNGLTSAKATADAADGYFMLSSDNYPRLLDLMDNNVDYKCWARPSAANDAFLTIAYEDEDGEETLAHSTTSCPASVFTLLEKEDYSVPGEITKIAFRMRVYSDEAYTYFDPPRAMGISVQDYMLPDDFQNGEVQQVWLQISGYSDDACDDLHPTFREEFGWTIIDDGSYKYLHFPYAPGSERKIRLVGYCPLEADLEDSTDTITLKDEQVNLLLHYAAHLLYEMQKGIVSSDMVEPYERGSVYHLAKAEMLRRKAKMTKPPASIRWRY